MKLNIKSNSEKGKYILIIVLGIVFYIILAGKQWVAIEDDSIFYMNPTGNEGVMPGYPFFLAMHKWMFGTRYLDIAVITQGILALVCTLLFVLYLERRFYFRKWETVICYLFCMMPYAIYLPESNITHQIMTEGVAYSLVYLFFVIIMNYVQNMRINWAILVFIMNLLLMLLRSQLIVLFAMSRFLSLVMIRGFFEMDSEDVDLFDIEEKRVI